MTPRTLRTQIKRERRERLYALLERTAAYYVRVLWESPEAADARAYLAERGLHEDTLRAYRVGFAPNTWDRVINGSRRAGFSDEELFAAGLAHRSRGRSGVVDRFRGRVTFPLTDVKGHVLGFGARAMTPEQQPKYLNTSDGEVFHKNQVVYGADMARAAAAKAGRIVIVEGYTDVIALHQAGVPETVAQMGTALTENQVDLIARLAPKALLCQDPDSAGQASAKRGLDALTALMKSEKWRTRSVEFRIVRLPAKQDPADVVQNAGAERDAPAAADRDADRALRGRAHARAGRPQQRRAARRGGEDDRADAGQRAARRAGQAHRRQARHQRAARRRGAARAGARAERRRRAGGLGRPRPPVERWRQGGQELALQGTGATASRPGPPPEPVDPHAALARREQSEEAFLAYCIALPDEGERRLAEVESTTTSPRPTSRKAAEYLRVHLRHPGCNLPSGDEALARLVAKLTVDANRIEATPAKLELEALQLDLHRLERHIASARLSGKTGVSALAVSARRCWT